MTGKNNPFSLRTVRKKLLIISKLAGIVLILSFLFFERLPLREEITGPLWMILVVLLMLAMDFVLGRLITRPVAELNESAGRMAGLDFSAPCRVGTGDEFGELSGNLNLMAENLRQALSGLEEANERLEQEVARGRELLRERRELVDNLSHEMKTPLGVIRAYAEGLQDTGDMAAQRKYTQVILSETDRMNELINILLDLSALEVGALGLADERFDLVELVETVAGRLLVDAPDGDFELEYELPEKRVFVRSDRSRMEQVLGNLLLNARKNVRPGGVLRLSLTAEEGRVGFSVWNQGRQIPEDQLEKIWIRFYRGSESAYRGSGLGLAIVARVLSMQGISYGAENVGEGVRFYFRMEED